MRDPLSALTLSALSSWSLWRRLCTLSLLSLSLLTLSMPEEASARRKGFSSSRSSRSSSSRSRSSSGSRSSSWGSSRSSYKSKGGSFSGGYRSSSSLGSSPKPRSSSRSSSRSSASTSASTSGFKSSSSTRARSSSRARATSYSSGGRSSRYRAPRYRERYGSWWGSSSTWKPRWRSSPSYRYRFRDRYYGGGYSVGVWDIYFLSHATDLFWYHHWRDPAIQRALYQDHVLQDAELARLEQKVRALEAQQLTRDPDYLPEGVSPQDAYSDEYIRRVRREEEGSSIWLILFGSVFGGALIGYLLFFRRY